MIDTQSDTWIAVKAFAEDQLAKAAKRCTIKGLDPIDTEFERGKVKALSDLLDLPKPPRR